jgi:uncharacterized membrane protein YgaE (UPF0421/DUF939 family)
MDISLKDFTLLFVGAAISFIISWLFFKLPYQPIASYYLEETNEFYYETQNGFNKKKYFKRKVDGFNKTKISIKDFEKVKDNLVRRVIDC